MTLGVNAEDRGSIASSFRPINIMQKEIQEATLGGGCFWCLEAVFEQLRGVKEVISGYAGGHVPNPTYDQVCSGTTGHAEVVQIHFDPAEISYRDLLEIFYTIHDPTTPNRQGPDVGPQYRSILFFHNEEQERIAREVTAEVDARGDWEDAVVTQIEPLDTFYAAEAYHQKYYRGHSWQPYCQAVIAPKIAKMRKQHFDRLKAEVQ